MPKRPLDYQMGVEDEILKELRKILERAKSELAKELSAEPDGSIGDAVSRAQAEAIRNAVNAHLKGDWQSIGEALSQGRKLAAMAAVESFYEQISGPMADLLGKDGAESLIRSQATSAASRIDTVMARLSDSRRNLSSQVWKTQALSKGWLDSLVNQGLARGWDAKRLADAALKYVDPNTPGGASYAAMRLARTEINNAFHSQTLQSMSDSGVVEYVKWNLSRSHPDRDICDDLAEHRLGEPIPGAPEPETPREKEQDPYDPSEFGLEAMYIDHSGKSGWMTSLAGGRGADFLSTFSDIEKEAMGLYSSGETFFDVRDAWKKGDPYTMSDGSNLFDVLDRIGRETTLMSNQKIYREIRVGDDFASQLIPGSNIHHDFYASTSGEEFYTESYGAKSGKKILLEILAPKGTNVIPGALPLQELVLPHGSDMIVRRVVDLRDKTLVVVDLVSR